MGVTGASTSVSTGLSSQLASIRELLPKNSIVPLAVGFGVSTREHFTEVGKEAEGVVIGSQIVGVIKKGLKEGNGAEVKLVEDFCREVSSKRERINNVAEKDTKATHAEVLKEEEIATKENNLPSRFGTFGGAYVPEALYDCLSELSIEYQKARADPEFWKEWEGEFGYMNRPSRLYEAKRLTESVGGARIWFKREDLNHTGSHKVCLFFSLSHFSRNSKLTSVDQINNAIGQILLAKRIGKTRIIAETGAGQHGVATATVCAKFGLKFVFLSLFPPLVTSN